MTVQNNIQKSLDPDPCDYHLDHSLLRPLEVLKHPALMKVLNNFEKSLDSDPRDDHLDQSPFQSLEILNHENLSVSF